MFLLKLSTYPGFASEALFAATKPMFSKTNPSDINAVYCRWLENCFIKSLWKNSLLYKKERTDSGYVKVYSV